jgi:hypothetical protein
MSSSDPSPRTADPQELEILRYRLSRRNIILDKLFLTLLVAIAGYFFSRSLEAYKTTLVKDVESYKSLLQRQLQQSADERQRQLQQSSDERRRLADEVDNERIRQLEEMKRRHERELEALRTQQEMNLEVFRSVLNTQGALAERRVHAYEEVGRAYSDMRAFLGGTRMTILSASLGDDENAMGNFDDESHQRYLVKLDEFKMQVARHIFFLDDLSLSHYDHLLTWLHLMKHQGTGQLKYSLKSMHQLDENMNNLRHAVGNLLQARTEEARKAQANP